MNEEALLYSFELFSKDGYEGSIEDYKELIKTNEEALKHSYDLFSKDGYEGDEYKFQNLVGVEPVKTEAVATETAPVTAGNQAVDTGLESEDISLEQFEAMEPAEKRKLSYRDAQRLLHERHKRDKGGIDSFDVSSNDYSKITDEEKIKLQEEASKQLLKEYEDEDVVDFEITAEQIDEKAIKLLKEKTQPSLIESLGAQTARGFASFVKNSSDFVTMVDYSLTEAALNAFDDQWEGTPEQKQTLMNTKSFGLTGASAISMASQDFISALEPSIREYETQTITEDLENGDYLQAGQRAVGAALESLPSIVAASTGVGGIIALGASSAGGKFEEEFGKDPSINTGTLVANALATGGVEAGFELVTRGILKRSGILADTGMKKAAEDLIRGGTQKLLAQYGINTVGEFASEAGTKVSTLVLDSAPKWIGGLDRNLDWSKEWRGILDEGIVGSVFGISATTIGGVKNRNVNAVSAAESILMPQDGKQAIIRSANKISELNKDRILADTEGVEILDKAIKTEILNIEKIKRKNSQVLGSMNPKEIKAYASNNFEIDKLKSTINKPNQVESVKKLAEQDLKNLTEANNTIYQEAPKRRLKENIESVEKLANKVEGVSVEPLKDSTAIEKFIKDNNLDIDKKASEQQGFIFQNKETGEQTIIINKDLAAKEQAVNVAAHEFLHALLFQTVKDSPTTQVSLGNSLKSYLDKIDADQVKDSNFAKRLDQYKQDPNNVKAEEIITLFSDALATGDIKFNENVFTKIGDVIRRALQSVGVSVKFNNGKDVYNFVKDYNKSVSKGKLTKAQIKASKGVKGSLVAEGVTATSKTVSKESSTSFSKADEDLKIKESIKKKGKEISALVPEGTTKKQYDRRIVGDVYQKLIATDYLDKTIKNQFRKNNIIVENGKVYDVDIDTVIEDIKQKLLESTILRFNPEVNKDFGGFLMSELVSYRIGDVTNKLKLKKGTKRIDAEAGTVGSISEIADNSMSIEDQIDLDATQARSETRLIKATKILSKEQYDKVFKEVEAAVQNIDPKDLRYKNIKEFGAEVLSEITGVPAEKILDTSKNLSKGQATSAAMFIENNVDYIRKTLPKGAVTEAANEDLMNTATNLPNKVLKKLYNKNPRITKKEGLSPYTLKPNLKNQDILDAIGRFKRADGKKFQINPRTPEAVAMQGLLNIVERNISNELVRTVPSNLTLEQKQDVAAGKSNLMFSKSVEGFDAMYNIAFSRRNSIELNEEYGFKSNWYDLDVMAKDWPDTEAKFLKDYEKFVSSTAIGGFRPDFFISSKNTLNPNSKPGDKFYEEAHAKRKATRAKIELINEKYNLNKIGFNSPPSIYGKTVNKIIQGIKNGKINEANQKYGEIFDKTWISIAKLAREDKKMIPFILHFMETAGNTSHWHRLGAEFIAYDVNPKKVIKSFTKNGKKVSYEIYYEYEHAVQSHIAAKILLNAAFDKSVNFQAVLRDIKENYKLIALSLEDAGKLNKAGYALKMPKGWKHWWERYFNNEVASISGGINPDNIKGINNIELSKELRVTSDGVKFSKSLNLDKEFNDIIENKTGIESYKNYKKVKAQVTGASKGKFNFFIAPSAEDFVGLLYKTLGKGKIGDAQMAWYKENLLDPYARAMQKVSRDRNFMARNFLAIKKELKIVPKNLKKKIPGEPFTQEQAIRVYIWNKKGSTIPEISENDSIYLTNFVENNEKLKTFADQVIALSGLEDYAKPGDSWVTGTITTDMLEALNTTKRAKYLELWQQNADEIFSEKNLNKLEAAFGAEYKEAMKNILKRMKTGRNRAFGGDSLTGRFVDWMTGATGAIMFFNTRSAVLQTLSAVNFINFGDNNIFAAAKAFANQKQYWSDFKMLFNSDFLVERRDGLKINVNEADIADIAKEKGVRGLINKLLKLGFTPTQLADSFAIATGGATFYRNRLKSLIKDGMDPVAAEKQAMRDFRETAEEYKSLAEKGFKAARYEDNNQVDLIRLVLSKRVH